jgi:hypothetical protein
MTTKIKYDNINYIKLKYDVCCFTPDQNTRLVRNEDMFFLILTEKYLRVLFGCVAV